MEYVNIMEAARRCGVSDKTIRRWIHAKRLRARFPRPNRCEIAISDLVPFLPGQASGQGKESLENRVAALELQIQVLERQLQQLLTRSAASRRERPSSRRLRESTAGLLPEHLVSVFAFAELHRIPERKVLTHIDISLLPVHRGAWTDHDGQTVVQAFDAKGRQAFHHLYHETTWFVPCTYATRTCLDTDARPRKRAAKRYLSQLALTHFSFAQRCTAWQNTNDASFFVSICADVDNKV